MGTRPCSSPARCTIGHSRPLAAWNVARSTASPRRRRRRRGRRCADSQATKPATVGVRSSAVYSWPRRNELFEVAHAIELGVGQRRRPGPRTPRAALRARPAARRAAPGSRCIARSASLDLGQLEKRPLASHPDRDTDGSARFRDEHGLRVGADQHGLMRPRHPRTVASRTAVRRLGLAAIVGHRPDRGHRSVGSGGAQPQTRDRAGIEHPVGGGEDLRRRPVVLLEAPRAAPGMSLVEVAQAVGSAPFQA